MDLKGLKFSKMHGIGNDFPIIDESAGEVIPEADKAEACRFLCHRHFGVGGDGVLFVTPSDVADIGYRMFNPDGSEAEMCGNGIRCFARFLFDRGYLPKDLSSFTADTLRGPLTLQINRNDSGDFLNVIVDMDQPILEAPRIPTTLSEVIDQDTGISFVREQVLSSPWGEFAFTCVSMGNPHAVCFLDDLNALSQDCFTEGTKQLSSLKVDEIGAFFESHPVFPAKCNIEFIVMQDDGLHMRVFERGCGETLACGTGACASLVAAALTKRSNRHNKVHLRGGILDITWNSNNHVYMAGPAICSFAGTVEL